MKSSFVHYTARKVFFKSSTLLSEEEHGWPGWGRRSTQIHPDFFDVSDVWLRLLAFYFFLDGWAGGWYSVSIVCC